jgi:hypothetical protein
MSETQSVTISITLTAKELTDFVQASGRFKIRDDEFYNFIQTEQFKKDIAADIKLSWECYVDEGLSSGEDEEVIADIFGDSIIDSDEEEYEEDE